MVCVMQMAASSQSVCLCIHSLFGNFSKLGLFRIFLHILIASNDSVALLNLQIYPLPGEFNGNHVIGGCKGNLQKTARIA